LWFTGAIHHCRKNIINPAGAPPLVASLPNKRIGEFNVRPRFLLKAWPFRPHVIDVGIEDSADSRALVPALIEGKDPKKGLHGEAQHLLEEPPAPVIAGKAGRRWGWPVATEVLLLALAAQAFIHSRETPPAEPTLPIGLGPHRLSTLLANFRRVHKKGTQSPIPITIGGAPTIAART
jgi:hypothetical protein